MSFLFLISLIVLLYSISTQGFTHNKVQNYIVAKNNHLIRMLATETVKETDAPSLIAPNKPSVSPEILAILTVYFVQGALGLSRLAMTFFLKDDFHLSPSEIAALGGISTLPWIIKPLYGFLSDSVPILGYKRRSYLIIAGIIGALSWICLGTIVTDVTGAIAANVIGSTTIAVSDVVVDSIVVAKSRDLTSATTAKGGDLQSLCWGSAAVGGLLSAYFSGSLLEIVSPRTIFCLTAIFPLFISLAAFFIEETREPLSLSWRELQTSLGAQVEQLKSTFANPRIYLPVLFIFAWQATPTADSALFFFQTNELGFKPEFLGTVRLAASVASLTGVVIFRTFLSKVKVKDVIFWSTIASVPLALTQLLLTTHANRALGIPDQVFALTDTVVLTVLGQLAFMPTLVLAASLCPPGVEGTVSTHARTRHRQVIGTCSCSLRSCLSTMRQGRSARSWALD